MGHAAPGLANVLSVRVLVLGGDGMLGRMIRLHLGTASGFSVDWTSRRENEGSLPFRAESVQSLIDLARQRGGYDFVVNGIAILRNAPGQLEQGGMADANYINAVFPHALAEITGELGAKLVHISTDAVFAPSAGRCSESDLPAPADAYGRMKLLGEPSASNALTFRCSIVGPNPVKKTGLLEWVLSQPSDATIKGYDDQRWNGVTTLQFAKLCAQIFQENRFVQLRDESSVHHFCPNEPVTKYELVQLLCQRFRPDVQVERTAGGAVSRILETGGTLRKICGPARPMAIAIDELSTYIVGPKSPRG
jgi:dTDP-4-dehydrorhamnose reductase